MTAKYSVKIVPILILLASVSTNVHCSMVNDITGDTGAAQSGHVTISGGSSGARFDTSSASTITESFNFISLPPTDASGNGQVVIGDNVVLHSYGTTNIFAGGEAGNTSLTGGDNTACGGAALNSLTSGAENTALGQSCLVNLTEGVGNTAVGALVATGLTTGNNNILIGVEAGSGYSSNESGNIIIGENSGVTSESYTIRIGGGQTQDACYIDGIYGASVDSATGLAVYVDYLGKLGTIVSSEKQKTNIKPIGHDSAPIINFNPVSFILKNDPNQKKQYGLIAEQVYTLLPDIVVLDKQTNSPYAVRYDELPVLILNELQIALKKIHDLRTKIEQMEQRMEQLRAELRSQNNVR